MAFNQVLRGKKDLVQLTDNAMMKYITKRNILQHPPYYNNKDNKLFLTCCLAQSEEANKDGFSQRNTLDLETQKVAHCYASGTAVVLGREDPR